MFGFIIEEYVGYKKYLFTIIFSSFFGNLLGGLIYPYYVSVGSPGFIFSILTLNISFLYSKSNLLGP